jgi:hypothetical protein
LGPEGDRPGRTTQAVRHTALSVGDFIFINSNSTYDKGEECHLMFMKLQFYGIIYKEIHLSPHTWGLTVLAVIV